MPRGGRREGAGRKAGSLGKARQGQPEAASRDLPQDPSRDPRLAASTPPGRPSATLAAEPPAPRPRVARPIPQRPDRPPTATGPRASAHAGGASDQGGGKPVGCRGGGPRTSPRAAERAAANQDAIEAHLARCDALGRPASLPVPLATGIGRPSEYLPEYGEQLTFHMAQGLSLRAAAARCGIALSTLYLWRQREPLFMECLTHAKGLQLAQWEDKALVIADKGGGPGGAGMTTFMLRNLAPETYVVDGIAKMDQGRDSVPSDPLLGMGAFEDPDARADRADGKVEVEFVEPDVARTEATIAEAARVIGEQRAGFVDPTVPPPGHISPSAAQRAREEAEDASPVNPSPTPPLSGGLTPPFTHAPTPSPDGGGDLDGPSTAAGASPDGTREPAPSLLAQAPGVTPAPVLPGFRPQDRFRR